MQLKYYFGILMFCISCGKAPVSTQVTETDVIESGTTGSEDNEDLVAGVDSKRVDHKIIAKAMMASNEPVAQNIVLQKFILQIGNLELKQNGIAEEHGYGGAPCGTHSGNGQWYFLNKLIIIKMKIEETVPHKTKRNEEGLPECKTIRSKKAYKLMAFKLVWNIDGNYELKVKREDGRFDQVILKRRVNNAP